MKMLLTILLLGGIYLGYYAASLAIDREISVPPSKFEFADISLETRDLKSFDEYRVIAEKPLFDPNREPFKKAVVAKVSKPRVVEKPLTIKALGIAVTGENLIAVVQDLSNGKILRLSVNDDLHGWTLTTVSADSFTFTKGKQEKIVSFKN